MALPVSDHFHSKRKMKMTIENEGVPFPKVDISKKVLSISKKLKTLTYGE